MADKMLYEDRLLSLVLVVADVMLAKSTLTDLKSATIRAERIKAMLLIANEINVAFMADPHIKLIIEGGHIT